MRRLKLDIPARRTALLIAFVALFLAYGVPRWVAGDPPSIGSRADANFTTLCRDHGGTPRITPAAGGAGEPERRCTVRYGARVYVMDAITPGGFDEDTARFQRQGCQEAQRQDRASPAASGRPRFVYHPVTGVCERRP